MYSGDLVADLVDAFRARGVDEHTCRRIERDIRNSYARAKVYVRVARGGPWAEFATVLDNLDPNATIIDEARRLGVHRATIYRHLQRSKCRISD